IWGEDLGGDVLGGEDLGGAAPVAWASSPPLGGRPAPKPPQGSTAPLTPTLEGVKLIAESFLGEILQVPPMYSAVKVGGRKLYELARKGQVIERKARRVVIHGLNVRCESVAEGEKFFLDVSCSKGTYIRSLCADIGDALGCGAVMGDLVRTRSGRFSLGDALTIEEIKAMAERGEADKLIVPPDKLLPYPSACVTEAGLSKARNGNPLPSELVRCDGGGDNYWMYDPDGDLIGLFCEKNGVFRAEVML
ncbi:MAG: hypothetical protein FWF80_01220, partial [Defluviitaleaceae bacterium]|nr:hypothetical protein [Defluviitaleaceae bacterium]